MFQRALQNKLVEAVSSFPGVLLTGPRQSGKTTLIKKLFPTFKYVLLESPDILLELRSDPRAYLEQAVEGWIFDEAQLFPELFSYLQEYLDQNNSKPVILTGSQNFLLSEKITQSLAGRVAVLELLPLSISEITSRAGFEDIELFELMVSGQYPRPYQEHLSTHLWYQSYIQTYLERDVRQVTQVGDLSQFQLFLKLCAGRTGQILNLESLGADVGISQTTAKRWISILISSRIIFLLQPYFKNFKKRLVKRPKIYFYDSSLICGLLGIKSKDELLSHSMRGPIFESLILSDISKNFYNRAEIPPLYYWRDHRGLEVDCVLDLGSALYGVEIKSAKTLSEDFSTSLLKWAKIASLTAGNLRIIYGGNKEKKLDGVSVLPWNQNVLVGLLK